MKVFGVGRVVPEHLDVAADPVEVDEVDGTVTDDLERDVGTVDVDVGGSPDGRRRSLLKYRESGVGVVVEGMFDLVSGVLALGHAGRWIPRADNVAVCCHIRGRRLDRAVLENLTLHLYRVDGGRVPWEIWFHTRDQAAVDALPWS